MKKRFGSVIVSFIYLSINCSFILMGIRLLLDFIDQFG